MLTVQYPCSRSDTIDADHAPEKGEQWDAIADDYQSLIIPGWYSGFYSGPSLLPSTIARTR